MSGLEYLSYSGTSHELRNKSTYSGLNAVVLNQVVYSTPTPLVPHYGYLNNRLVVTGAVFRHLTKLLRCYFTNNLVVTDALLTHLSNIHRLYLNKDLVITHASTGQ